MTLLSKTLFTNTLYAFIAALCASIFLFVFIDASLQTKSITLVHLSLQLSLWADWIAAFAFLLSQLWVFFELKRSRLWIMLQTSGYRTITLLKPMALVALLAACGLWLNSQFVTPFLSLHNSDAGKLFRESDHVHVLPLQGNATLYFQRFDPRSQTLYDVLIHTPAQTLWRIKALRMNDKLAYFADKLTPDEKGMLQLASSYEKIKLSDFALKLPENPEELLDSENQSLTLLASSLKLAPDNELEARTASSFARKLFFPLLPLLTLIIVTPYAVRFQKTPSLFGHFMPPIALFVVVVASLDALDLLSRAARINPLFAFASALSGLLLLGLLGWIPFKRFLHSA